MLARTVNPQPDAGRRTHRVWRAALSVLLAASAAAAVVGGSSTAQAAEPTPGPTASSTHASGDPVTPLLSYDFDDDSGTTVVDSSGNAYDATWQNGPTTAGTPAYVSGISGHAAHVNSDNTNQNIKLPLIPGKTDGSGSFAVEFWWYDKTSVADAPFFGNQDFASCGNPGIAFYHNGGYGQRTCGKGLGYAEQNNTTTFQNTWAYYTLVYDATAHTYSYYINGKLAPVNAYGPNPLTTPSGVNFVSGTPFYLGNDGTGAYGSYADAYVDDVNFYDQVIPASQVSADYDATNAQLQSAPSITVQKTSVGGDGLYSSVDFTLHAASLVSKYSINDTETDIDPVADFSLTGVKAGVAGAVEGRNVITITTADGRTASQTFQLDSVPPTISLNQNPGMNVGFDGTYQAVSFVLRDNDNVGQVSINGKPVTLPILPVVGLSHVLPGSDYATLGDNTIAVSDRAGNTVTEHFTLTDAPIVAFSAPGDGSVLRGIAPVAVDIAGAKLSSYQLLLDKKNLMKAARPASGEVDYRLDTTKVKKGAHTLTAVVVDGTGHTTTSSIAVIVDN